MISSAPMVQLQPEQVWTENGLPPSLFKIVSHARPQSPLQSQPGHKNHFFLQQETSIIGIGARNLRARREKCSPARPGPFGRATNLSTSEEPMGDLRCCLYFSAKQMPDSNLSPIDALIYTFTCKAERLREQEALLSTNSDYQGRTVVRFAFLVTQSLDLHAPSLTQPSHGCKQR
jgi:hypothetical protein